MSTLRALGGLTEVKSSEETGKPEIVVRPRRRHLAESGLDAVAVGMNLRTAYEGEESGVYREDGEEYDVVVRYIEEVRRDPGALADLHLTTPGGYTVPVTDIGLLETGRTASNVLHRDKIRMVEITANTAGTSMSEARAAIAAALRADPLPAGVDLRWGGNAQRQDESFASILEALILAIVLLYLVLAAILESFVHPLTVMVTLPLGLIGRPSPSSSPVRR